MVYHTIKKKGKTYYLYETYDTWRQAYTTARYYRRKNKSHYIILQVETGYLFPEDKYALYMDKVFKLF